jgi:lipid A 3-O-deacylase
MARKKPVIYESFIFRWLFLLILFTSPASLASETKEIPLLYKSAFGLVLHDRGPASDRHEHGLDPNWELQLNPSDWKVWRWIGAPYPMLGLTPNFNGDTSVFYGGITYELSLSNKVTDTLTRGLTKNLFLGAGLSAAIHNGPLHKNQLGCEERSDCGFGYRVLPRLNVELGSKFLRQHGISLFYDHMSHKGLLPGENEGIDHIGIRYHYYFNNGRP